MSLAVLAISGAVVLILVSWFLWWFFTDFWVIRGL